MYYLFLDDERNPQDVTWVDLPKADWVVVRNYDEFVKTIQEQGHPLFVAFDHDLADEHYVTMLKEVEQFEAFHDDPEGGLNIIHEYGPEKTGYDCAKWLVDRCMEKGYDYPDYVVHSMNPIGKQRIINYVEGWKSFCENL